MNSLIAHLNIVLILFFFPCISNKVKACKHKNVTVEDLTVNCRNAYGAPSGLFDAYKYLLKHLIFGVAETFRVRGKRLA